MTDHPAGTIAVIRIVQTGEEIRCVRTATRLASDVVVNGWADLTNLDRFWNDGGVRAEVVRVLPVVDLGPNPERLLAAMNAAANAIDNGRDGFEVEAATMRGLAESLAEQLRGLGPAEPIEFGARVAARTDNDTDAHLWIRMNSHNAGGNDKFWTDGVRFRAWCHLRDIEVLG